MSDKYYFNPETKELLGIGEAPKCPPGGIAFALFEKLQKHAHLGRTAQIEGETGQEDSYADFLTKCIKISMFLTEQGIKEQDIVTISSENTLNDVAVLVALLFIGAVPTAITAALPQGDIEYCLKIIKPKMIFACEVSIGMIETSLKNIANDHVPKVVPMFDEKEKYTENILQIYSKYRVDDVKKFAPVYVKDPTNTFVILFTSGTTGLPKAALLSQIAMWSELDRVINIGKRYGSNIEKSELRTVIFNGLFWSSSVIVALGTLYTGNTRVTFRKYNEDCMWDNIEKYQVNLIGLNYAGSIKSFQLLSHKVPHLRSAFILGGILPSQIIDGCKRRLPHVSFSVGYGTTETGTIADNMNCEKPVNAYWPPTNGNMLKIVDPETDIPQDLNKMGEIRVKTASQMSGYMNVDSSSYWDAQGFYKTGDLGYLDENYRLHVVDRLKETFKYLGWHVSPCIIESAMRQHPGVMLAIVIGIPAGVIEHALGLIVLKPGVSATAAELLDFIEDKVDHVHQLRAGVKIIQEEQIPYTVNGKINRNKLKQMFCASEL